MLVAGREQGESSPRDAPAEDSGIYNIIYVRETFRHGQLLTIPYACMRARTYTCACARIPLDFRTWLRTESLKVGDVINFLFESG